MGHRKVTIWCGPLYQFNTPSLCPSVRIEHVTLIGDISLPITLNLPELTYLFTFVLPLWSRVLLEKLTGSQLVEKFPAVYGTRRCITAFIGARHLSLSSPVHTPTTHSLKIYLSIIFPSKTSFSQVVFFPQVSQPKPCIRLIYQSL
jgi:hypothetical protein